MSIYILSDVATRRVPEPQWAVKINFAFRRNVRISSSVSDGGIRMVGWRRTNGIRYHHVADRRRLCPLHGSPWWTLGPSGYLVEHPTFEEAEAYCRLPHKRGSRVVEAVTLRHIAGPFPHVEQLGLFEEV